MATRVQTRPSLGANISWTFGANLVYAACQWGMLVTLMRLGSPEIVGHFALGLALSTPALALAGIELRAFQATDMRREYAFGDYLALRLLTTVLAIVALASFAAWGGYDRATGAAIIAVALAKAVEALSDLVYGLLQQHERLDQIALSTLLRGPLALGALALGLAATGSLAWACLMWAAAWAGVLLAYDLPRAIRLLVGHENWRPRWHRATLLSLVRRSAPLGVTSVLIALYVSVPRSAVERALGAEALGIFAATAYLERVGTTVVSAIGQAASPRLARAYRAADTAGFRRLARGLIATGIVLGLAGVTLALTLGSPLLGLVYPAAYIQPTLLAWIMAAAGLWYVGSLLGYIATASRRIDRQPLIFLVVLSVSIVASYILVPAYGLVGAAQAMVVAAAVAGALFALLVKDLL